MEKALKMTSEEQVFLMKSLYVVFNIDGSINLIELFVLNKLGILFSINEAKYKSKRPQDSDQIAEWINSISDLRVRCYFLRIIHDVHRASLDNAVTRAMMFNIKQFENLYNKLVTKISIEAPSAAVLSK
ncbi:MAG: hypothetical protein HQL49_11835 [Gammaproteobacteria bacterium]|nr:hypothetical protein [Gammaproteobacteria bacterium]